LGGGRPQPRKKGARNEIALPNGREPALMRSSHLVALLACLSLAACEAQRARLAADAQASMVGRTKEQVLACMGPPAGKDWLCENASFGVILAM
jgi:hypothetical protein